MSHGNQRMVISFSQRYETVADSAGNAVHYGFFRTTRSRLSLFRFLGLYRSSIVSLDDIMLAPSVSTYICAKGLNEPLYSSLAVREPPEEIRTLRTPQFRAGEEEKL